MENVPEYVVHWDNFVGYVAFFSGWCLPERVYFHCVILTCLQRGTIRSLFGAYCDLISVLELAVKGFDILETH